MSYSRKHNKIKNTGILFEMITRQITVDVLNNETDSSSIKILKEFFNTKTELGKENELYKILLEKKYKNSDHAEMLVDAVIKSRKKLSNYRLRTEKYNLIKKIKENYNLTEFFNSRISNYKVLASIYNIFEGSAHNNDVVIETDSKVTLLENIITNSVSTSKKVNEYFPTQEEDIRLLTYQLLVDKFNKKYSNLNENQKDLLREYINNLSNTNSLKEFINTEVTRVQSILKSHLVKVGDKITKIKLTEAIAHMDKTTRGKYVKDSHVVALMRYYELIMELENVHQDK